VKAKDGDGRGEERSLDVTRLLFAAPVRSHLEQMLAREAAEQAVEAEREQDDRQEEVT
jgi:hypothetical protein